VLLCCVVLFCCVESLRTTKATVFNYLKNFVVSCFGQRPRIFGTSAAGGFIPDGEFLTVQKDGR
jgi:hypothetical protein